jgi:hypothetical protein
MPQGDWIRVSRQSPCPLCGKPDNCSVSQDGQAVWCGRVSEGAIGENAGGQYLHRLVEPWAPRPLPVLPSPRSSSPESLDLAVQVERWAKHAQPHRERLAAQLGVSTDSITALEVGWQHGCWTFPERDSSGAIIGINRRSPEGTKRRIKGTRAGLTYSPKWDTGTGPILLVEGASDTAAVMDMGLSVIGRPSNNAGVAMLAEMLRAFPEERQIVVIGEHDQKPDGRWPGREGAIRTAQGLADRLGRSIHWSLPSEEAKDVRALLNKHSDLSPKEVRETFQQGLEFTEVLPSQPASPPRPLETGIDLKIWREQMSAARQISLSTPGCYTDASPTGAGKSHVDLQILERASHSDVPLTALLVLPTHENGREVVEAGRERGLSISAYPARSTDSQSSSNCWNPEADRAESMGLAVQATVCCGCPERERCRTDGYLHQLELAQQADITVCTHKRVEHSGLADLMSGRDYVSIHENPIGLLRPEFRISERDLQRVGDVLSSLLSDPVSLDWFGDATVVDDEGHLVQREQRAQWKTELYDAVRSLHDLVGELQQTLRQASQTMEWERPPCQTLPAGLARLLFRTTLAQQITFHGQPWRFVLAALSGRLSTAAIQVESSHRREASGCSTTQKWVIGFGQQQPAPTSVTWFNDATTAPERLQSLVGGIVQDRTPAGRLVLQRKAVQIPRDITRNTALDVVVAIVRGLLADRLEFPRVGLIVHSNHKHLYDHLEPLFRNRIVRTTYFGSGDERSSNAWHQECDLILVLGTPRLPPSAVASYLIQVGELATACQPTPWGELQWQGRSESGEPVVVSTRGYTDAIWQRANQELVRATLVQAIGRGRGILESGCEVVVVSTEECGLPLSDQQLVPLSDTEVQVWSKMCELSPVSPIYILGKTGVSSVRIAHAVGLSETQTRHHLVSLERRGLARRVGQRGGWLPVVPVTPSISSPGSSTVPSSHSPGVPS